mmetsp:Transcript_70519/g.216025  ORF Transcript_70519/g.216025 Transcript_70519/m.216025 type:complete len:225 (+) Transcript_70519:870-1544(+)
MFLFVCKCTRTRSASPNASLDITMRFFWASACKSRKRLMVLLSAPSMTWKSASVMFKKYLPFHFMAKNCCEMWLKSLEFKNSVKVSTSIFSTSTWDGFKTIGINLWRFWIGWRTCPKDSKRSRASFHCCPRISNVPNAPSICFPCLLSSKSFPSQSILLSPSAISKKNQAMRPMPTPTKGNAREFIKPSWSVAISVGFATSKKRKKLELIWTSCGLAWFDKALA